jgi:tellurite methyltransferase
MEPKPASKLREPAASARPNRKIVALHQDDAGDWVADLECGHTQHVRHDPPWQSRPWVTTPEGRASRIGTELDCAKCVEK